jgi:hypothetical protein
MIHPNVLDAYEQAVKVLKDHDIPFRATGGIVGWLHSVAVPVILECGGKRSATPLWLPRRGVPA